MQADSIVPASAVRSQTERRSGFDRRGLTLPEHLFKVMIELGGGKFRGIQPGDHNLGLEPLVLFDGPSKSTLCLKPCDVSSRRVRLEIEKKEAEFAKFLSQAAA
jgi:hypothetical protein